MISQNPVFIGTYQYSSAIIDAMQLQTKDHRSPDFVNVFGPVLDRTKRVFGSQLGRL